LLSDFVNGEMLMKCSSRLLLSLFCIFVVPSILWAKDSHTVAVLPFSVHSADNIDYVRKGVGDMLSSRISANEKIRVVGKDVILAALQGFAGRDLTAAEVYDIGKKLKVDFAVWGSITKIGNSLSIDGKLADIATGQAALTVSVLCPTIDEVIPKVNEIAQRIDNHIAGSPAQVLQAPTTPSEIIVARPQTRQPTPQVAREAEIISGLRGGRRGTFTSSINPDFISAAQPLDSKSFWKSQQFAHDFRGMDIGDVTGDGLNETVIIDSQNVLIYQKKGVEFIMIHQVSRRSSSNLIAVDVADINRNGIREIIVSSYSGQIVDSFVVEFTNGKFETIADDLPWFLRVIENTPGSPVLLGQRRGMDDPFDTPIYEITWQEGRYREGQRMRIPEGLPVYGLTIDKLTPGGSDMVLALSEDDYLYIFEQTNKHLSRVLTFGGSNEFRWKSDDYFGGSNTRIEPMGGDTISADGGMDPTPRFINLRIIPYDTNKDGKREFIVVKNHSASGRLLSNVKLYSSAEVYNLEWDGMGMVENWRTKKINGYIADFQFKDIDNDGENDIVLALVLTSGGFGRGRSVIVSYKLQKE
jgi:TolB-like protein